MSIEAGFTMYEFLCRHSKCACVVIQLDKAMLFVPEATVCVTTISFHGLCFWTKGIHTLSMIARACKWRN